MKTLLTLALLTVASGIVACGMPQPHTTTRATTSTHVTGASDITATEGDDENVEDVDIDITDVENEDEI